MIINKQDWLDAAEVFDSWRIWPRLLIGCYLWLLIWVTHYFAVMYFAVPASERTVELTAFVGVVTAAAFGALPFVYQIYTAGGRDWDAARRPPVIVADVPP